MPKFLRRNWDRFSKLGKTRKKKRVWRKPKGRHNKVREKMKGYPAPVEIGYGTEKKARGKIQKKTPVIIYNLGDLKRVKKDEIIIIGKVGKKKKIEIAKKAEEMKLPVINAKLKKLLKANKKHEEKTEKVK